MLTHVFSTVDHEAKRTKQIFDRAYHEAVFSSDEGLASCQNIKVNDKNQH